MPEPEPYRSVDADGCRAVAAYLRLADAIDEELATLDSDSEDHARLTMIAAAFRGQTPRGLQLA
jgi:hypothetical protein